jgi:hypothetical protein
MQLDGFILSSTTSSEKHKPHAFKKYRNTVSFFPMGPKKDNGTTPPTNQWPPHEPADINHLKPQRSSIVRA